MSTTKKSHLWSFIRKFNDTEKVVVSVADLRQLVTDCGCQTEDGLLSVRDAADLAGVTIQTMYNRILKGRYPDIKKVDNRWVITKKSIGL